MRGLVVSKWEECDGLPFLSGGNMNKMTTGRSLSPSRENEKNTTRREHTLPPRHVNRRPTGRGGASPSPSHIVPIFDNTGRGIPVASKMGTTQHGGGIPSSSHRNGNDTGRDIPLCHVSCTCKGS